MRALRVLPVIVRGDEGAIAVVQLDCWILKWITNPEMRKRRTESAHKHGIIVQAIPTKNESGDEHILARLDKSTRTDVTKFFGHRLKSKSSRHKGPRANVVLTPVGVNLTIAGSLASKLSRPTKRSLSSKASAKAELGRSEANVVCLPVGVIF